MPRACPSVWAISPEHRAGAAVHRPRQERALSSPQGSDPARPGCGSGHGPAPGIGAGTTVPSCQGGTGTLPASPPCRGSGRGRAGYPHSGPGPVARSVAAGDERSVWHQGPPPGGCGRAPAVCPVRSATPAGARTGTLPASAPARSPATGTALRPVPAPPWRGSERDGHGFQHRRGHARWARTNALSRPCRQTAQL